MASTQPAAKWKAVRSDRGSALLTVLVVLTVTSLLGGAVLAVVLQQRRLIRFDVQRLQARYAAEAAVYLALEQLERDPAWRPNQEEISVFEDTHAVVTVRPFGGYYLIEAEAVVRRARSSVRAVAGSRAAELLRHAVVIGDQSSALHVGGQTRITGDLLLGPRGLRESPFRGAPFRGYVDGRVIDVQELGSAAPSLPRFASALFEETIRELDALAARPPATAQRLHAARARAARRDQRGIPSSSAGSQSIEQAGNRVYVSEGPAVLTAADTVLWQAPATLIVRGPLTITGGFRFPRGSQFIAESILLSGAVTGKGGLFYGRDGVESDIDDREGCSAQLLSRSRVVVGGRTALDYPSVLFVSGATVEGVRRGHLEISDQAIVRGSAVYPSASDSAPSLREEGSVVIGPEAVLQGALYTAGTLELLGTVEGSVLAHQVLHRAPPRVYLNWLVDAKVDVHARPGDLILPVGLRIPPRMMTGVPAYLDVLYWEPVVPLTMP